jgi:hypothetical protein
MKSKTVFLLAGFLFSQTVLFAHPGRTDKYGGHNGPNGYHYHNGGSGGSSKSSGSGGSSASGESGNTYITSQEEMKELQTLLKGFGFYTGPVDGDINSAGSIESANRARIEYGLADPEYSRLVSRSLLIKLRTVKAGS